MSSDEDLAAIRRRKMLEMQQQAAQQQAMQQQQHAMMQQREAQIQAILRKILSPEARQRLTNIKMVRPEFAQQLELQLIQVAQSGRVQLPISDEMLKRLLTQLMAQQTKRDIKITRR